MGAGAGKKGKDVVQKEVPKPSSVIEIQPSNRSPQQPSQLPAVPSRQTPVRGQLPSLHSRASTKQSTKKQSNGIEVRTPLRQADNNSPSESGDDVPLPPIGYPIRKSDSRPSTRASSSESLKSLQKQPGRCSRCPHCREMNNLNNGGESSVSTPKPKWLTENPRTDQIHIDMDKYDIEAVKKYILLKNGHLPGSYDYRPHLTIEQMDDYDYTKEHYYTQPIVATTKPRVLPICTPFPEYDLLQRRERRLNKPFTLPLFDD